MRGALALICASAVAAAGVWGGPDPAGGETKLRAPSCLPARVTRGNERHTLRFFLPLCSSGYIFSGLTIAPSLPVSGPQESLAVSSGASDDHLLSCRVTPGGVRIRCFGPVHGSATVSGSFRVRGDRCRADTLFTTAGGLDCDPDVPCPAIGRLLRRRVRAPTGCA